MTPSHEAPVDEAMQRWPLSTTIGRGGSHMLAAAFSAPLIGIRKRWPYVLHAVTMEEVVRAWPRVGVRIPLPRAACGARGLRLFGSAGTPVAWPPRVKGLAPFVRCPECHAATGRRRPRSELTRRAA